MGLELKEIALSTFYPDYGEGAVPGYKCEVTLRAPDSYSSITIKLSEDKVRDVIATAVKHAMETFSFDAASINVKGTPGKERPKKESFDAVAKEKDMPL